MTDPAHIEDALECGVCNQALDWHLVRCRPMACPVVADWVNASDQQREAAMAALVDAGSPDHGLGGCGRHSP